MTEAREDRLERLFEEASMLSPERRPRFLEVACGGDEDLRLTLAALISDAANANEFGNEVVGPTLAQVTGVLFGGDKSVEIGHTDRDALRGQRIAHFLILEKLGSGGMGRVYKAVDLRLDRTVALKLLPAHLSAEDNAKQRFAHEAKAASALDHPNICVIYEIGETDAGQLFIAMAYCDGATLKQKIASGPLPIAEALEYVAQIAEGLQRAHDAAIVHRDVKPANVIVSTAGVVKIVDFGLAKMAGTDVTREGIRIGTVAYMSPEQTRGEPVDARSDIWSIGALLHELLTGQRPFRSENDDSLIYAIRHDKSKSVRDLRADVPAGLDAVVDRCLEKEPARRYQRASDLLADVRTAQQGGVVRRPVSVARALRYSSYTLLLVAALFTTLTLRGGSEPVAQSAAMAASKVDPEARALYLQSVRVGDEARAMSYLEQAIAKDSTFALAHARIAVSYIMRFRDKVKAERAIATAIALDPTLSDAYDALGLLRMWLDRDWPAAEAAFRHAIKLDSHDSMAHHELGQLLMRVGRCDDSVAEEQRAVLRNPGVAHFQSGLAEVYLYCRRYDEAIREFTKNLDVVRDSAATYWLLGDAYFYQGRYAQAFSMYAKTPWPVPAWAYVPLGRKEEAQREIVRSKAEWARGGANTLGAWNLARSYASLGDREQALTWLERTQDQKSGLVVYLKVHPHFDSLRAEPRFVALLRKSKLIPSGE